MKNESSLCQNKTNLITFNVKKDFLSPYSYQTVQFVMTFEHLKNLKKLYFHITGFHME